MLDIMERRIENIKKKNIGHIGNRYLEKMTFRIHTLRIFRNIMF